jgi:hypothetical protein
MVVLFLQVFIQLLRRPMNQRQPFDITKILVIYIVIVGLFIRKEPMLLALYEGKDTAKVLMIKLSDYLSRLWDSQLVNLMIYRNYYSI